MKILVCGARACKGNKKAGGSFEFAEVFALSPIELFQSENFSVYKAAGSEFVTLNATESLISQLTSFNLPCEVEFEVTNQLKNGQLVPVLESVKSKAAA